MLNIRPYPKATPGTGALGDRDSPDPDGVTVEGVTAVGAVALVPLVRLRLVEHKL